MLGGGSNDLIIEDFRLLQEEWVGGTRRRIYLNSQGYMRAEGYTPESANDQVIQMCKAAASEKQSGELRLAASIPDHIINQIWLETGQNPLEDEETTRDLILNNPDLRDFRTGQT